MTTTRRTQKTPSAVLAGVSAEGLNSPTWKKESMMHSTVPTRIALDERTSVDVDPVEGHVELTITSHSEINSGPARSTFGIALTATEARKLASALLDGVAPAFGHASPEALEEHVAVARKLAPAHVAMSPAKAAAAMRRERQQADLDVQIEIEGSTITDVWHEAQRLGVTPSAVMRKLEEAQ